MNRLTRYLLLFIACYSTILSAQPIQNIDSLLQVNQTLEDSKEKAEILARLYNAYLYSDQKLARNFAIEEIELSGKIDYKKGVATGLYHLGVYYNNIGDVDSTYHYYKQAKELFEQLGDTESVIMVNHGMAINEYSQGNYEKAISILKSNIGIYQEQQYDSTNTKKTYDLALSYDLMGQIEMFRGNHNLALQETMKALKLLERLDKPIRKADAMNHLASIEFYLNNYEKCISYNLEALEIYKKYNDKYYAAQVLNDIGNTYFYMENYANAIKYLEQSLGLSKEMEAGDLIGTAMSNLGKVYAKQKQFDQAILYFNEALDIHESSNSQNKIIEALNDLGMAYNSMHRAEEAILIFNRSIDLAKKIKAKENLKIGYFNRSESYEMLHRYNAALADFKSYKYVDDSIFNMVKSRQIEELRAIYETEKKEKEITLQKSEILLLEEKDKVNVLQRMLLSGGLLLSILILTLVYYSMGQKIKRNKAEKGKVEAELAFKKKELTTHALHLANKNEILEDLKLQFRHFKNNGSHSDGYNRIVNTINFNLQDDKNWENFSKYFEEVHKDFNTQIKQKYPNVTSNELRLMALLKMNLSSKEIANILNISAEGIKKARYRLRKKLNINTDDSLQDLIISL